MKGFFLREFGVHLKIKLKMITELDNFQTSDSRLYLFPDMLQGQTKDFLFEGYEIKKETKSGKPWLVWIVKDNEGVKYNLSHYTIYSKARKLKADEIHLHTWSLTKDMNNQTKMYMVESKKPIAIDVESKK